MIGWPEGELQLLLVSGALSWVSWEDVDTGIRTRGRDKGFWFWYVEDKDVGTASGDLWV